MTVLMPMVVLPSGIEARILPRARSTAGCQHASAGCGDGMASAVPKRRPQRSNDRRHGCEGDDQPDMGLQRHDRRVGRTSWTRKVAVMT
jgi:hypothetical protein